MDKKFRPKVDARALIARLNQEGASLRERQIIAPLLPKGKIRTRLNGLVYEFKPRGEFLGWGSFRPVNEREAELEGEALPWQRAGYLELLPALRVILLWPDSDPKWPNTWLALPFNESDARQRFGLNGAEPVPVFLCDPTAGAQSFERVLARVDGGTLWFDQLDSLADPTHAEWLREASAQAQTPEKLLPGLSSSEKLALTFWQVRQLEVAERIERQQLRQAERRSQREQREWLRQYADPNHLEVRLRHALTKAEATLHSFSETTNPDGTPGPLIVEWSENGQTYRYRSVIDRRLNVVSSGICLSGRDNDFDLTSLVNVMVDQD
jgi:hypothetical protein